MLGKIFRSVIAVCVLSFAAYTWYQYAWTFEDVFITFRVIDNFLHGYGLRWNIDERVQVFTHPLWMFLLTPFYAITREIILTTAVVSGLCTALTILLLYRSGIFKSSFTASALVLVLFLTTTFPTYSSSGFENPLNHLLVCIFMVMVIRGSIWRQPHLASLVATLGMLTRLDTALVYLPTLAVLGFSQRVRLKSIALGLLPLLGWEIFSLVYYGTFVPNTAPAKLPQGIGKEVILRQGWAYICDLCSKDLLASVVIVVAFLHFLAAMPLLRNQSDQRSQRDSLVSLSAGIILYCLYIVWIGGDYLSYRFWSLPLFAAGVLGFHWVESFDSTRSCQVSKSGFVVVLCAAVGLHLFLGRVTASQVTFIGDDRVKEFFAPLRLAEYIKADYLLSHTWKTMGLEAKARGDALHAEGKKFVDREFNVGLIGYYAGPEVHVVDIHALTDPLLARLPSAGPWMMGHFPRQVPVGYVEWLAGGSNLWMAPELQEYVKTLELITRDPVFSTARLRELIPFALGLRDKPLVDYAKRVPQVRLVALPLSALSQKVSAGAPWNDSSHIQIPGGMSLEVIVDRKVEEEWIDFSADCNDLYRLDFKTEGGESFEVNTAKGTCPGMSVHRIAMPDGVQGKVVKKILVGPVSGDGYYSIGHLLLVHEAQ